MSNSLKKNRDFFIMTVGRLMIMASYVVGVRVITAFLLPEEIGRYNIILTVYGWFLLVLMNPVGMYTTRKFIEWKSAGLAQKYFLMLVLFSFSVAVLASVLMYFLNQSIGIGITIKTSWFVFLVFGSAFFIGGNLGFLNLINLFGHRMIFITFMVLTIWLGIISSVVLCSVFKPLAEFWLLGQILAQGVIFIITCILLFKILGNRGSSEKSIEKHDYLNMRVLLNFSFPLAVGNLIYWLHSQGYRFLYQRISGSEALGYFLIGFGIGVSLMASFDILFNQYYHPFFYKQISHAGNVQKTAAWNQYASAFFPAIVILMVFVVTNSTFIAKVFTAARFHGVGFIIMWGAMAESLRMVFSATSLVSHACIETKPTVLPSLIGMAVALACVIIFVPVYSFAGCGFAIAAGWLAASAYIFINMKKLLPIKIAWKRIFYAFFLCFPMVICYFVFKKNAVSFNMPWTLFFLFINGLYLIFAQFILARKWLSLPFHFSFVDRFERKISQYYLLSRELCKTMF